MFSLLSVDCCCASSSLPLARSESPSLAVKSGELGFKPFSSTPPGGAQHRRAEISQMAQLLFVKLIGIVIVLIGMS